MRARFIYEKFTQDSDPIADMKIGMIHQIEQWMKSVGEDFINKDHALETCSLYGKLDFVKYLLAAGADVHADNNLALRWASRNGYISVVKVLLDAGADVHANNDDALRGASYNGHVDVVKVLLTAGANVHANDDLALRWANENGYEDVVKVLKDHIAKEKKKKIKESVNEKFIENSDPISDMGIGEVTCPYCIGTGSCSAHDYRSVDPETGEHDCRYCPIEVECEYCNGTGYILKKDLEELNYMKDPDFDYDIPF